MKILEWLILSVTALLFHAMSMLCIAAYGQPHQVPKKKPMYRYWLKLDHEKRLASTGWVDSPSCRVGQRIIWTGILGRDDWNEPGTVVKVDTSR